MVAGGIGEVPGYTEEGDAAEGVVAWLFVRDLYGSGRLWEERVCRIGSFRPGAEGR